MVLCQLCQGNDILCIDALHDHRVQFDLESVSEQFMKGAYDLFEILSSSDLLKTFCIQSVETQIDFGNAQFFQFGNMLAQQGSIRSDVNGIIGIDFGNMLQQFNKILP